MKKIQCIAMILVVFVLTACGSEDNGENKNNLYVNEVTGGIDLESKKIDSVGLAGTWLLITEEASTNEYPHDSYADTAVTDTLIYSRISYVNDTQIIVDDGYHFEQQIFTVSGNKLVVENTDTIDWDISIVDENEMLGTSSFDNGTKSYERRHRMVKVSANVSVGLGVANYELNINSTNDSGIAELTGYRKFYTVWTENYEGGNNIHTTSGLEVYLENGIYFYIYDESSHGDEGYQVDDGNGAYISNDLEGVAVSNKVTSINEDTVKINDSDAYNNGFSGVDIEFTIDYSLTF